MGLRDSWHNPDREARLIMEDAAKHSKGSQTITTETEEKPKPQGYRIRSKLYDKIKVSVHTMDIIIGVLVALLVIAIAVGIITGGKM